MEDNFILATPGIQPQSMADMRSWQCPPPDPLFHPYGWDSPAFTPADPRYVCNDGDLIRKLGSFGGDPGEIPGSSCLSNPLGSPPNLGLKSNPAEFAADPGFVEQVEKFSCFGSSGFNRGQFALAGDAKLGRVSSSPSLNGSGLGPRPGIEIGRSLCPLERINSMESPEEESSVIEPVPSAETGTRGSGGTNPRKRKAAANRGKANAVSGTKRCKPDEVIKEEGDEGKLAEEAPKDYIHVRARRGQATDSHSLAERVRREKISERMKLLQDLVPGCNKVTGKAVMLDEIINYVQSLQRQVEFLSMKLASVNSCLDSPLSKDHHHHMYNTPHNHNHRHRHQMYDGEAPPSLSSDLLHGLHPDRQFHPNLAPPSDLQYGGGGGGGRGDDYYLQTIVEMGMGQRSLQDTTTATSSSSFHPQFFHY